MLTARNRLREGSEGLEIQMDIVRRVLSVSETGLEGLEHIHERAREGDLSATNSLFQDVVYGVYEIQKSLNVLDPDAKSDDLGELTESLMEALNLMVSAYENEEAFGTLGFMQFTLIPRYRKWKDELDRTLRPTIQS